MACPRLRSRNRRSLRRIVVPLNSLPGKLPYSRGQVGNGVRVRCRGKESVRTHTIKAGISFRINKQLYWPHIFMKTNVTCVLRANVYENKRDRIATPRTADGCIISCVGVGYSALLQDMRVSPSKPPTRAESRKACHGVSSGVQYNVKPAGTAIEESQTRSDLEN